MKHIQLPNLMTRAYRLLITALPFLLAPILTVFYLMLSEGETHRLILIHRYLPYVEHLVMSLTLLLLGALLLDLTERELS